MTTPHRVAIIGSGFGGLFSAQSLRKADVEITLIGRTTHHLFQPLLYQVATGILSPGSIAPSTREVLASQKNARVVLGDVTNIDLADRTVTHRLLDHETVTPYDSLIVAAGAGQSYFGNDHFAEYAPGMKSIDDALELRGRIFGAFELAEVTTDPDELASIMTFVVVGAGPTGVEMAGQIAELSRRTLRRDFRHIDPTSARVILLDAAPKVLPTFGDRLGVNARRELERIGVEVHLDTMVTGVDSTGIEVRDPDGTTRRINSLCKVWAAGVQASPLGRQLAEQSGVELDRAGRVRVNPDLTIPDHPEVYVLGDMIALNDYPGVAQLAIQTACHAAKAIEARVAGAPASEPFHYRDKGSMATITRFKAVASIGRVRLTGFVAWLAWLVVHLIYIIGFKHRVTTLLHWLVSFIGRGRAERAVTLQQIFARNALNQLGDRFSPSVHAALGRPSRSSEASGEIDAD